MGLFSDNILHVEIIPHNYCSWPLVLVSQLLLMYKSYQSITVYSQAANVL